MTECVWSHDGTLHAVWSHDGTLHAVKHGPNQRTNRPIYTFSNPNPTRTSLKLTWPKAKILFAARSRKVIQVTIDLQMMDQGSQSSAFDNISVVS
jgi:hypothetical protein